MKDGQQHLLDQSSLTVTGAKAVQTQHTGFNQQHTNPAPSEGGECPGTAGPATTPSSGPTETPQPLPPPGSEFHDMAEATALISRMAEVESTGEEMNKVVML